MKNSWLKPPAIARWIISRLSVYRSKYLISEDLREDFDEILHKKGNIRANLWYWKQCLHAVKFYTGMIIPGSIMMFRNYLKIALRLIGRRKGYSFINIAGLSVGMACCILITLYCLDEISFDSFHKDAERLYRVGTVSQKSSVFTSTSARLAPALKETYPQVEAAARIRMMSGKVIRKDEIVFKESRFMYANADFLKVFALPFINGVENGALDRPYTVILSSEMAEKYFGNNNPVGKMISIDNEAFQITGVISNPRENTHLKYGIIASFKTIEDTGWFRNWQSNVFFTYIKIAPGTDINDFESNMKNIAHRYSQKELEEKGHSISYFLHPVKDIHLYRYSGEGRSPSDNLENLYSLSIVGLFIIFLACVNYVNLATARSSKRSREIGQRKVVGARRTQLISQLLMESVLTAFIALSIGLLIASAILPMFNSLSEKTITYSDIFQPDLLLVYISIVFVIGVTSGAYSAFFMSSFQPAAIIKSGSGTGITGSRLRRILVVSQFSITIILIVSTFVVYNQLEYMKNENLGFDLKNKIMLPISGGNSLDKNYEAVKTELGNLSKVSGTAITSGIPGGGSYYFSVRMPEDPEIEEQWMNGFAIDYDYLTELNIRLVAGRYLDRDIKSDLVIGALINSSALEVLGFNSPDEAINKRIWVGMGGREIKIIGVTEDFHFTGLRKELYPLFMTFRPNRFNTIILSLENTFNSETIKSIKEKWFELFPNSSFDYYFLKDFYDRQYDGEESTGRILSAFTVLAIFISCTGLFGLASFLAEQRKKEVGIRKVFGATVPGIVFQQSKEFILLVIYANLWALPVASILADKYLQDFAYRRNIDITLLIITFSKSLIITFLTISFQSIKTAIADPVDSLRYE